jgi:hypothetical protein
MGEAFPDKVCRHCGRSFSWRKKWEKDWEMIKYCSGRCRGESKRPIHQQYEAVILRLVEERGPHKSICPSEAARAIHGSDEKVWPQAMEHVRSAARRLAREGKIQILRKGKPIHPDEVRGLIRLAINSPAAG